MSVSVAATTTVTLSNNMSSTHPSTMLAESLAEFSKAAYKAFAEVESQSRSEIARAVAETREMRAERDKALKELQNARLDTQSWRQEAATAKSAMEQAELTMTHQTETLATQVETITQLRRELNQWKDQSRNWQEHFLRVEQERCVQSSRLDELVVEKLRHAGSQTNPSTLFTPPKPNAISSAPSSTTTKRASILSPTQPPAYKSTAPHSDPEQSSSHERNGMPRASNQAKLITKSGNTTDATSFGTEVAEIEARPRKTRNRVGSHQVQDSHYSSVTSRPTIIRRVHAIVSVKQESDSEDETSGDPSTHDYAPKEESIDDQNQEYLPPTKTQRTTRSRKPVDYRQESVFSDEGTPAPPRRLRSRNVVNYGEDNDEEEDELTMGAEDNHEEVYGHQPVETADSRSKVQPAPTGPPKKKRKFAAR